MATASGPTPTSTAGSNGSAARVDQGSNAIASGSPAQPAVTNTPQGLPPVPPPSTGAAPADTAPYDQASFQPTMNQADMNSGMLKDGRIRNPVPSKLKGKTDNKKGNFAVMHMNLKGKDLAPEREGAAKRTSESTELAAKMAYKNGYVSLRRSRFVHVPDDSNSQPFNPSVNSRSPAGAPSFGPPPAYRQPLGSSEIKGEQARLLTLLRSISPNLVVDQICKALAFFGGIPGAPPPADGRFPESEKFNGSGALFVGWIAEIFPNLGAGAVPTSTPALGAAAYLAPQHPYSGEKRPRGRPKGSKASKFRSDKGIKKGPKRNFVDLTDGPSHEDGGDDSWVDVDDTVLDGAEDRHPSGTPLRASNAFYAAAEVNASGRKRGRPKGSKNRPKDGDERTSAPITTPIPESGLFSLGRKKAGRPKGSKNKPRESAAPTSSEVVEESNDADSTTQPIAPAMSSPNAAQPQSTAIGGADFEASARSLTQQNPASNNTSQPTSFQAVNAGGPEAQPSQTANPPVTNSGQTTKKRKRKGKDAGTAQGITSSNAAPLTQVTSTTNSARNNPSNPKVPNRVSQTPIPVPVVPVISAPPPPKRQRKSKEPKPTPAKSQDTAANIRTTEVAVASQAPDQSETQVYTSPTIEELEAQLEEHANSSPPPPVPPIPAPRPQQTQQQAQGTHQKNETRQAMLSRQQRQRQHQTASPNMNQASTASPHLSSVQSASPSLGQVHSVSPNMGQQQGSQSQTPNSVTPQPQQQQARNSQSFYSQGRPTQSQYGQQSPQQQQVTQAQQYSAQPQKSQFVQQQQQQTYSPQQQPQFSAQQNKQQGYSSQQAPQRYPSQQQQQYSSYATTSSNSTPQTLAQQSPQFGATSSSSFNSNDGSFRTGSSTGMSFNNSSFGSMRTTTASPSDNTYRGATNNYGSSTRQASSFSGRTPLPSSTSSHTSVQGVQSLPSNLQGFQNFTDLSSFDMSNLDTSGNSGLGLNAASYNMGTGNVSRGSSNTGSYATSAMTNFDTNLGGNDRFYVGRR